MQFPTKRYVITYRGKIKDVTLVRAVGSRFEAESGRLYAPPELFMTKEAAKKQGAYRLKAAIDRTREVVKRLQRKLQVLEEQ